MLPMLYRLSYAAVATAGLEPATLGPKEQVVAAHLLCPDKHPIAADGVRTRDPPIKSRVP